jgi:hypothetical protein
MARSPLHVCARSTGVLLVFMLVSTPATGSAPGDDFVEGLHLSAAVEGGLITRRLDRPTLGGWSDAGASYRIGYGAEIQRIPVVISSSTWNRSTGDGERRRLQYTDVALRVSAPRLLGGSSSGVGWTPTVGFTVPTSVDFSPWTVLHAGGRADFTRGPFRAALLGSVEYEIIRASSQARRPLPVFASGPVCRPEEFRCGPTSPADLAANLGLLGEAHLWGPLSLAATTRVAYDVETRPRPPTLLRIGIPERPWQRLWDSAVVAQVDLGRFAALSLGAGATKSLEAPPDLPVRRLRSSQPAGYDPYGGTWRVFASVLLRTEAALSPLWLLP